MSNYCAPPLDLKALHDMIDVVYTNVAEDPDAELHFNTGIDYAESVLGYDRRELEELPARATARFAGLGNPHAIGPIEPGETVLDLGCGAGMDLLLAARRVGRMGHVIGVDPNPGMRRQAWTAACEANLAEQVELRAGDAENLPVESESVDVVISNGVMNLSIDKQRAFNEIARVLKPGGRLYLADGITDRPFGEASRSDPALWAS